MQSAWGRVERRRWRERELPRRRRLALAAAPLLVAASYAAGWLGPVQALERKTADLRFTWKPPRSPDPRILTVSVDEATLAAEHPADAIAPILERIFDAGARGVAVDLLLPERWSHSRAFGRLVLEHADDLTLAVHSSTVGEVVGAECIDPLVASALGPERLSDLFAFVNLDKDPDGVMRTARLAYQDGTGAHRPAFGPRAARALIPLGAPPDTQAHRFWIDHSISRRDLRHLPWASVARQIESDPSVFQGRLVVVGANYVGAGDIHEVPSRPGSPATMWGFEIQALIADTVASGLPVRELTSPLFPAAAGLTCAGALLGLLALSRARVALAVFAILAAAFLAGSYLAFRLTLILVPFVGPMLVWMLALGLGLVLRRVLPPFPDAFGEV